MGLVLVARDLSRPFLALRSEFSKNRAAAPPTVSIKVEGMRKQTTTVDPSVHKNITGELISDWSIL